MKECTTEVEEICEKKCSSHPQTSCKDVEKKICDDEEDCKQALVTECTTEVKEKCEDEHTDKCVSQPKTSCRDVEKRICLLEPNQECEEVPKTTCKQVTQAFIGNTKMETKRSFFPPKIATLAVDPLEGACRPPGRVVLLLSISVIIWRFSLQRATEVRGLHLDMV